MKRKEETLDGIFKTFKSHLYKYKMIVLEKSLGDSEFFQIWKCDETQKSSVESILKQADKVKNVIVYQNNNCIILLENSKINIILFDWSGLEDIVHFFETSDINKNFNDNFRKKLEIIKYEIDSCLIIQSKRFKDIVNKYSNMIIKNCGCVLYKTIIPDLLYDGSQILKSIPGDKTIPINKIEIYTDPYLYITAIRINDKHPNADSMNWFCLGDLKLLPLNIENIERILNKIKIWNINDSYWVPEWFETV